eukprot:COSAG01_NODE_4517_length_4960_cov_3.538984_4_plen_490_part_00
MQYNSISPWAVWTPAIGSSLNQCGFPVDWGSGISETGMETWPIGSSLDARSQKVELLFGTGTVTVELGAEVDVSVITKPEMAVIDDPHAAVDAAVQRPVSDADDGGGGNDFASSCLPLHEQAQGKQTACILICDITRPVPNAVILPVLVHTLIEAGVPASGITVLVATGLHRPNEGDELRELVGDDWVLKTVSCVNHFARADEDHVAVGVTSRGTVAKLDKRFVTAQVRIATGLAQHSLHSARARCRLLTAVLGHLQLRLAVGRLHNGTQRRPSSSSCDHRNQSPTRVQPVSVGAVADLGGHHLAVVRKDLTQQRLALAPTDAAAAMLRTCSVRPPSRHMGDVAAGSTVSASGSGSGSGWQQRLTAAQPPPPPPPPSREEESEVESEAMAVCQTAPLLWAVSRSGAAFPRCVCSDPPSLNSPASCAAAAAAVVVALRRCQLSVRHIVGIIARSADMTAVLGRGDCTAASGGVPPRGDRGAARPIGIPSM